MGNLHTDPGTQGSGQDQPYGCSPAGEAEEQGIALRERLHIYEVLNEIACSMLQPSEVVAGACRELGLLFPNFHFSIAVYFPETRLFVVHAQGEETKHVPCEEIIAGYFLQQKDETTLAIEDCEFWVAPPPLNPARGIIKGGFHSGLFAASRIRSNLIGVLSLQRKTPFVWDAREVEMLQTAAAGFGLAYYHAVLCDNLMYSCRTASQQLAEVQEEAIQWQQRAVRLEVAAEVARAVGSCRTTSELLGELRRSLGQRWPQCRIVVQRYIREKDAFEIGPIGTQAEATVRTAQNCLQKLFLNRVPVMQILCNSPQEIAGYRDLDPQLVSECEKEGFRSLCSAPIYQCDGSLWGTLSLLSREPSVCELYADQLAEIGRALVLPIRATELHEGNKSAEC